MNYIRKCKKCYKKDCLCNKCIDKKCQVDLGNGCLINKYIIEDCCHFKDWVSIIRKNDDIYTTDTIIRKTRYDKN